MTFLLIQELLTKYKPDVKFEFYIKDEENMDVSFDGVIFNINKNDKWIKIKKRIDSVLKNKKESGTCELCEKEMGTAYNTRVSCSECYNVSCFDCYIEIYKANEGLSVCPFCRYTIGEKLPPYFVELGVEEMESVKKMKIKYFKKEQKNEKK